MQGTQEWRDERCGMVTGSRFADVLSGKNGGSKTAESYMFELIAETITGIPAPEFYSKPTDWGKLHEAEARQAYVIFSGETLKETGFIRHPLWEGVGCSPDSMVGLDGILEIKCPYNSQVHLKTILDGRLPKDHEAQVQGNMWVTGRQWCDFVSYDPRMKEWGLDLFLLRVNRDDDFIEQISESVVRFRQQIDIKLKKLKSLGEAMREAMWSGK